MVGYVYILKTSGKHYYIGSTNDLNRRLEEHRRGKTKSLKKLLPIQLAYFAKYDSPKSARKIEIKLKKFKNKQIIERIIKDRKIKLKI